MNTLLLAPFPTLLSGLITGILFGFILRKALVTRFDIIVNQLLLRDFTVMKVILTAIACGSLGIYGLHSASPSLPFLISKTTLFSTMLGGTLFGIGMAIMGYCPGTGVGALADGARDMWFGVLGMIVGAALYAHLYPWIVSYIKPQKDMTTITLNGLFGISPWFFIAAIWCMLIILYIIDPYKK